MGVGGGNLQELEQTMAALRDPTRRRILLGFYDNSVDRTIDDVAAGAGVHRTVAFQHLERLAALGYLTTDQRRGLRGKPAKVYRLAAGREAGRNFGRSVGVQRAGPGLEEALVPLTALGGRYVLKPEGELAAVNCVFREACVEAPLVVCGLHAGMLEGVLAAAGQPHSVLPLGPRPGDGCAFAIEPETPAGAPKTGVERSLDTPDSK